MIKELREEQIKLEDMTNLEFTQLLSQWKQEMFRNGMKNINKLEITVLENSLEPETSKKNIQINALISNHLNILRGVENE